MQRILLLWFLVKMKKWRELYPKNLMGTSEKFSGTNLFKNKFKETKFSLHYDFFEVCSSI